MKVKKPTQGQFLGLWETAVSLGLDREMVTSLVDDKSFSDLMKNRRDEILAKRREESENILTFELKATVRQDRPYIEALEAGAPNTPSDFNARKVGDQYPPVSDKEEEVEFILRNFPKGGGSWDKALAWAKANGYKLTNPREAFAVTEQNDLRKLLDRNWLYLTATTECTFEGRRQAVYVCVRETNCHADLYGLEYFDDGYDWFLFRK